MPPTEIGKYKVLRELGRGAMGAVYLGEDPFIGRRVAIKVMRPQVEEGAERFLQEARTVGSLSHPNIVLLHDFGFAGELPYLVMEHVDGTILDKWLAEPRDARERLRVLAGLCRAVAYAHSRGVLHRDLKPSNVLVRSDGEAKLLDFGIALVENTRMTATGVVLGTPEYLAPELLGSGRFSPRSDMYALGLVAYELFGGRNPFAADTVAACPQGGGPARRRRGWRAARAAAARHGGCGRSDGSPPLRSSLSAWPPPIVSSRRPVRPQRKRLHRAGPRWRANLRRCPRSPRRQPRRHQRALPLPPRPSCNPRRRRQSRGSRLLRPPTAVRRGRRGRRVRRPNPRRAQSPAQRSQQGNRRRSPRRHRRPPSPRLPHRRQRRRARPLPRLRRRKQTRYRR